MRTFFRLIWLVPFSLALITNACSSDDTSQGFSGTKDGSTGNDSANGADGHVTADTGNGGNGDDGSSSEPDALSGTPDGGEPPDGGSPNPTLDAGHHVDASLDGAGHIGDASHDASHINHD
jgi:hypothetical protein